MTTFLVHCLDCGGAFEPDPNYRVAGVWEKCPACTALKDAKPPLGQSEMSGDGIEGFQSHTQSPDALSYPSYVSNGEMERGCATDPTGPICLRLKARRVEWNLWVERTRMPESSDNSPWASRAGVQRSNIATTSSKEHLR